MKKWLACTILLIIYTLFSTHTIPVSASTIELIPANNAVNEYYSETNQVTQWRQVQIDPLVQLYGIWGLSSTDIYAVGYTNIRGVVYHYTDEGWSTIDVPVDFDFRFYDVWGTSPADIYFAGIKYPLSGEYTYIPFIMHFDGVNWTTMDTPEIETNLKAIWGTSENDIFAVGAFSTILHFDGTNWVKMDCPTVGNCYGVHGDTTDTIYVACSGGKILRLSETNTWELFRNDIDMMSKEIFDVFYCSGTDIYAVGSRDNNILVYDGSSWTQIDDFKESLADYVLYSVWAHSADDVYIGGWKTVDYISSPCIVHIDGETSVEMDTSSFSQTVLDIWGCSSAESVDVYAVGGNSIYYFNSQQEIVIPEIVTNSASNVTSNSSYFNGSVISLGNFDMVDVSFEYGIHADNFSSQTDTITLNQTGGFQMLVNNLEHGKTYYYKVKCVAEEFVIWGDVVYFDTLDTNVLPGDVDGNGAVDALDITKAARIILGFDEEIPEADVNQDDVVNVLDMTKIIRIILGFD
ncbi:MAG: dockerin type I repeat-containing protein [Dehalococcoidales bacterium]|nr:dockerin type I repeat-containing protein [Dehalococcoidales bacterium]